MSHTISLIESYRSSISRHIKCNVSIYEAGSRPVAAYRYQLISEGMSRDCRFEEPVDENSSSSFTTLKRNFDFAKDFCSSEYYLTARQAFYVRTALPLTSGQMYLEPLLGQLSFISHCICFGDRE